MDQQNPTIVGFFYCQHIKIPLICSANCYKLKIEQRLYTPNNGWQTIIPSIQNHSPQMVLVFGNRSLITNPQHIAEIADEYPSAILAGCSTSGEIGQGFVKDQSIITTAVFFERSTIQTAFIELESAQKSFEAGEALIQQLEKKDLRHVLVLSEGLLVNGSQLTAGIQNALPKGVTASGGLAGDDDFFQETILLNTRFTAAGRGLYAIGFYGNIQVSCGSFGGWDIFGVERTITKSKDNIIYEIDHQPALTLYKSFLGEFIHQLPASALLFPLSVQIEGYDEPVVRTILSINDHDQSMVFAGDIPEGSRAKLMKSNVERLVNGASIATQRALQNLEGLQPELALLVSCVGRKLVMKQWVEDEVEAVQEVIGKRVPITGFYSYGEIAPFGQGSNTCSLHNQTMTVTLFREIN